MSVPIGAVIAGYSNPRRLVREWNVL